MEKEFYTIKEFCELFRISRQTLYFLTKEGKIKTIKIGGRVLISKEEVEKVKKGE